MNESPKPCCTHDFVSPPAGETDPEGPCLMGQRGGMLKINLDQVSQDIQAALKQSNRSPDSLTLIAVSKTQPVQKIMELYDLGIKNFGENYVQEALPKIQAFYNFREGAEKIIWHFLGPIQSNKTKLMAENFDWVHSISSLKIAERLSHQRPKDLPKLKLCIQININQEPSKSGLTNFQDLKNLAQEILKLPNLTLMGLMCIPENNLNKTQESQTSFSQLKNLLDQLNSELGLNLKTLSMGMSGDFKQAILEGSTMIRVGTKLFGARA